MESQHHNLIASVLWCSASFRFQLSHPDTTPGKAIALIVLTFVDKVMSLRFNMLSMIVSFNMLSMIVIVFLPRSKRLLISWPLSPSAVILEPKKIKSVTVSTFHPSVCSETMGLDAMVLVF